MLHVPLSKVDLNLLVVLDVLLRERSVSRAAQRLNLTPSAVSHALNRLRCVFENELLVRDGRSMVPTARGHALAREVPKIIGDIEHMLAPADPFVPSNSSRTFRLIAPDFIMPMVVTLLRKSREDAPGISLELVPVTPDALADMKQGRCDALVAPSGLRDDALRGHSLGLWPWAVFGRTGHKAFADWSPASWARYPHLQVRAAGPEGKGPVDQMAAKLSLTRKIGAIVPHFSAAAFVLAETDLLLTVPTIAVQGLSNHYGLEQREVPFALPPLKLSLFHNAKKGDEPDVRWFRDEVKDAFSKMA